MRKRSESRNRAAFTLMELMLVMAILVIMGGMVAFGYQSYLNNATMGSVEHEISVMEQACLSYKFKHLQFPNTLDDLVRLPSGMTERQWGGPYLDDGELLDPWRNPFQYSKDEQADRVLIRSAGPDGQMNTNDDIPDPQAT